MWEMVAPTIFVNGIDVKGMANPLSKDKRLCAICKLVKALLIQILAISHFNASFACRDLVTCPPFPNINICIVAPNNIDVTKTLARRNLQYKVP
jgi:hypothetical protein